MSRFELKWFSFTFFWVCFSLRFHCPLLRVRMSFNSTFQPIFGVHTVFNDIRKNTQKNRHFRFLFEVFDSYIQVTKIYTNISYPYLGWYLSNLIQNHSLIMKVQNQIKWFIDGADCLVPFFSKSLPINSADSCC